MELLGEAASWPTSDATVKVTDKQANAIELVITPRIPLVYIITERARGKFHSFKKIQKTANLKEKPEKVLEQRRAAGEAMEPARLRAEKKDEALVCKLSFHTGSLN